LVFDFIQDEIPFQGAGQFFPGGLFSGDFRNEMFYKFNSFYDSGFNFRHGRCPVGNLFGSA